MKLFEVLRKTKDFWRPLMGFMDYQGKVVIEPQFLDISLRHTAADFSASGYAIVKRPGGKQSVIINKSGETVFEFPKNHGPSSIEGTVDRYGVFGVVHRINADNSDNWRTDGRDRVFIGVSKYFGDIAESW